MSSPFEQIKLTDFEFNNFAELIYKKCAIKLTPAKKTMLSSRLSKRLRALGLSSFKKYYNFVSSPEGEEEELVLLINEVSTNKTDFFREADHFKWLIARILPEFAKRANRGSEVFKVWSAGCSSGEEPYTLAMLLGNYKNENSWFDFKIFATDISTKVLAIAEKGVYSDERLEMVPADFLRKFMMRGKGKYNGHHKMVPEIQKKIRFKRLNFLDNVFRPPEGSFDLILCRNVIIYFDIETQINLFKKFYECLQPGGNIFIGHSETLHGMEGKLKRVAPAIYKDIARK